MLTTLLARVGSLVEREAAVHRIRLPGDPIGIWAGPSAMALAIGPLVGGLLTEHVNWNWIFYVNVPVGLLGLAVARLAIDESRDTSKVQRLDFPGLATSALALFSLTYGLTEGNTYGWSSARIAGSFAVAVASFAAFIVLELRQRVPMLDLSLFRDRTFAGANVIAMMVSLAMFGVFFFVSLFVQQILHYSPVQAGAIFLPMTILIVIVAPVAGRLSDRIGSRWLLGTGMTLLGISLLLYARMEPGWNFWNLLPEMVIGGLGMAITMTPMTAAAMSAVPVDKAGVGSAVLNTFRQVGGSLGIALMGAILALYTTAPLRSPQHIGQFVNGLHHALLVSAGIAFAGALIGIGTVRRVRHDVPSVPVLEAA